ncbi:phage holin family protein [Streptomyces sp. SID3343]|uniref:phage holin family protein n=1 Tax=Streptomyces sp. SID3343 TaxID=2690260 RepID=UPI00136B1384|nr:phage holin family protein [Streptomyces sp. SID3343]MYV98825.1 phage holin family protein [Streptomyces sp. SID3343]
MAGTDRSPAQDVPVDTQRSIGELFSSASRDMSTLVRSEIALAKSEVKVSVVNVAKGGGAFGAAAFVGVFAFIFLSFAVVYGIHALGLGVAWSFLIVGGFYLLLAGGLAAYGIKSFKQVRPPARTIATTKDTVTALKNVG